MSTIQVSLQTLACSGGMQSLRHPFVTFWAQTLCDSYNGRNYPFKIIEGSWGLMVGGLDPSRQRQAHSEFEASQGYVVSSRTT